MVSGPLVGFGLGYGVDFLLETAPFGKLVFFFIGIGAGFLNVWRDTRELLQKLEREDRKRGGRRGA